MVAVIAVGGLLPILLVVDTDAGWYRVIVGAASAVLAVAMVGVSFAEMRRRRADGG